MNNWINNSIFYHIYTMNFCGAPKQNDLQQLPIPRIKEALEWTEHIKSIGANAIFFGPLFESESHGYDTIDYYKLDRRLGTNEDFKFVSKTLHKENFRIILDGVFNHVGREFFAFKDVQEKGINSKFKDWFYNLNFNNRSLYNDSFSYEGWNGHYNLVKLNLKNVEVKKHILDAVKMWIEEFGIDGLRLDCADCLDMNFLKELTDFCRAIKPDFWIIGEIIHGDYTRWANSNCIDSVTNYECYKGIYSSHNDKNYFEIAHSLNRQFGDGGLYKNLCLGIFLDNHDVSRLASILKNPEHIYNCYTLLLTMPGIPFIYYGSEWAIEGVKAKTSDDNLRPKLDKNFVPKDNQLIDTIKKISDIRKNSIALQCGTYKQIEVKNEQFAFSRVRDEEKIIVLLNLSDKDINMNIKIPFKGEKLVDLLNDKEVFTIVNANILITDIKAYSYRIMLLK